MNEYVIYHEFGRRKLTSKENYDAMVQNASKIIDMSKFDSDAAAKQYLIDNWKLLENQIKIIDKS
jgi:hypothetical protein